jgi:hypothetical protein
MRRVTALGGTLLLILLPWLASTSPASAQECQPADAVTGLRGPRSIGVLYTTGFRPPAEDRR